MLDGPTPAELLATVAALLRDAVVPELHGALAFQIRVAANALDLARREIEAGSRQAAAEHARLTAMLGQDGSVEALSRALAVRLRHGDGPDELPGLIEHLWATTLAKIAVDQPHYASLRALPKHVK
jgi:hypothetical protein